MNADELVSITMMKARTLEADQLEPFLTTMAIACLATMRGTYGDDFVDGWLQSAVQEKNPIKIKAILVQQH